jgi:hypothetical protein
MAYQTKHKAFLVVDAESEETHISTNPLFFASSLPTIQTLQIISKEPRTSPNSMTLVKVWM